MDFDLPAESSTRCLLYSDALLPIFEVVINSIHTIKELNPWKEGVIRVENLRSSMTWAGCQGIRCEVPATTVSILRAKTGFSPPP